MQIMFCDAFSYQICFGFTKKLNKINQIEMFDSHVTRAIANFKLQFYNQINKDLGQKW